MADFGIGAISTGIALPRTTYSGNAGFSTSITGRVAEQKLSRLLAAAGAAGTPPAGTQRTASVDTFTAAGTVAAGALSVTFLNTGTTDATVDGDTLAAGKSVSFSAQSPDTLGAIAYVASATAALLVSKVV